MNKELRKKAKEHVENLHAFYIVATVFGSISAILFVISLNFPVEVAYWICFPIIVLALVLGIIYVSMFGLSLSRPFNSHWKEEQILREMARLSLEERRMGMRFVEDEEADVEVERVVLEEWG